MKKIYFLTFFLLFSVLLYSQQISPNTKDLNGYWWDKLNYEEKVLYCIGFIASNHTMIDILNDLNNHIKKSIGGSSLSVEEIYLATKLTNTFVESVEKNLKLKISVSDMINALDHFYNTNNKAKKEIDVASLIYLANSNK